MNTTTACRSLATRIQASLRLIYAKCRRGHQAAESIARPPNATTARAIFRSVLLFQRKAKDADRTLSQDELRRLVKSMNEVELQKAIEELQAWLNYLVKHQKELVRLQKLLLTLTPPDGHIQGRKSVTPKPTPRKTSDPASPYGISAKAKKGINAPTVNAADYHDYPGLDPDPENKPEDW